MYNTGLEGLVAGACVAAKVRRVGRIVGRMYDDALRDHGLTAAQLDLLVTLVECGGRARPSELARSLIAERSTITRNVARLERRGLVRSQPGSSSREITIAVTSDGEEVAGAAFAPWSRAQQQAHDILGPDGIAALDLLVERLTTAREESA